MPLIETHPYWIGFFSGVCVGLALAIALKLILNHPR